MGGAPSPSFTPYKGPEIFPNGEDEPGFRAGEGFWSVIGGDLFDEAYAGAEVGLALGNGARAGAGADESDNTAVGPYASAMGDRSAAFGPHADANGFWAFAAGPGAQAAGDHATAFGPSSSATYDFSFAFGANAFAPEAKHGALRANRTHFQPYDGLLSEITLYDEAGAEHVLGVSDTTVLFDGSPVGGGSAYDWIEDSSTVVTAGTLVDNLTYTPIEYSIMVIVNGLVQYRDDDFAYTSAPDVVEVYGLAVGDRVVIRYMMESP